MDAQNQSEMPFLWLPVGSSLAWVPTVNGRAVGGPLAQITVYSAPGGAAGAESLARMLSCVLNEQNFTPYYPSENKQ